MIANIGNNLNIVSVQDTSTYDSKNQSLSVTTNSLTNESRSTTIGAIYQSAGEGAEVTSGTLVQQGGYLSAVNLSIDAQSIATIGGAIEQMNADGSVNTAGTAALLANLSSQLGSNFTQSTAANDIHNRYIAPPTDTFGSVFSMAAMVGLSIVLMQPEMLPALMASATGLAASSAVAIGLAAGASGTIGSVVGQEIASGSVDWSSAFSSGVVSGLTAGLTQAFVGSTGMSTLSNGTVQANAAVTLANLPTTATTIAEQSVIGATVKTVIQGGSFGTALLNDVVNSAAAVGANAIGDAQVNGVFGTGVAGEATYLAVHAALGCAASAAEGTGCGGGAIGGAVSALIAPVVRDALYDGTETVTTGTNAAGSPVQITSYNNANINAVTTAISALAGGATAGVLGQNATAGVTWAANEAINNAESSKSVTWKPPQEPGLVGVYPETLIPIVKWVSTIVGFVNNSGSTTVTASDIPEIIAQSTTPYGTSGTTASVNSEAELNTLFSKLTEGGSTPVVKPYGTEVTLTDGTTVTLRNFSESGGETIDINYSASLGGKGNFKVHINQ